MAEGFIGLSVLATLRDPPSAKIVTWLSNGLRTPSLLVPGSNVLEIEIEPDLLPLTPHVDIKPKDTFVDPAIVSYGKPEVSASQLPSVPPINGQQHHREQTPPASMLAPVNTNMPVSPSSPSLTSLPQRTQGQLRGFSPWSPKDASASATLTGPFNEISLNGPQQETQGRKAQDVNGHMRVTSQENGSFQNPKNRGKRAGKKAKLREGISLPSTHNREKSDLLSTPSSNQKRRGDDYKGWRQTAFLEEPAMANIHLPRAHHGFAPPGPALTPGPSASHNRPSPDPTKGRRQRYREEEDQNGWATGEATDIQDMGDFDFEENHKKFDKRKVFDQIRRDDTTADEARLVSFNRLPSARSGTAGGKNLHHTENVLDPPVQKNVDHSSGDSDVEISEARISSGRSISRASARRSIPSRKASALVNTSFDRVASPKIRTDSSNSFYRSASSQQKPSLVITQSDRPCPCISPLQMLELEQLATAELDMTEDMMTENAARSIAQTAYGLTSGDDHTRTSSALIVILAGNNKTGSRAIATARHLRNHDTRVVLCILGLEREDDLLDSVRRQLNIFRICGGQAIKQDALMRTLRKLQSPTDLIIDALLGIHISFEDLRSDDQAVYFQLVCWANSCEADTLALDIPSGIDASTGEATFHDSTPLVINAQHIFSLGTPKTGLLTTLAKMPAEDAKPSLAVADIGISPVAWKKFGTRRRHGVEFGGSWVAGLEFRGGS